MEENIKNCKICGEYPSVSSDMSNGCTSGTYTLIYCKNCGTRVLKDKNNTYADFIIGETGWDYERRLKNNSKREAINIWNKLNE